MKIHTTQPHPNPLLGRRGDSYNKQAFTLVELIVVITILAILGTIAFVSLQGYSRDSRNSVRITDIKTTETALELYSLQTGKYPLPDNYEVVTTTGSIDLWNKGQFDTELLRKLDRLSDLPKDPKTEDLMGYSTTLQQKEYELKYNLEISNNSNINQTHAISSNSYVKGNYNGLFVVGRNNAYYSTPGLFSEASDVTSTGTFDLHQLQTQYLVSGITNSGTLITTANLENNQKAFAVTLKSQYANNPDLTTGIYEVLANLDVTSTGQLTQFTQAVTSGKASSLIVAASSETTPVTTYSVGNSALFDGTGYLNGYTPITNEGGNKWTARALVKRSKLDTYQMLFFASTSVNDFEFIRFTSSNQIEIAYYTGGNSQGYITTNAVYRDPSIWYDIVAIRDGSSISLYVDGVLQNVSYTTSYNTSNGFFTNNNLHDIGWRSTTGAQYFDGYMSEVIMLPQVQSVTDFGSFNSITGKWEPKSYTGVYGNNGFHLDFSSGALLGKDVSGNGNDWNVLGGVTQVSDSPTNNVATLNPLQKHTSITLSNGNKTSAHSGGGWGTIPANFVIPKTGKWYWEVLVDVHGVEGIGIAPIDDNWYYYTSVGSSSYLGYESDEYSYNSGGSTFNNNVSTTYGSSYAAGDVIGVIFDADAQTLEFFKQGVPQGITSYTIPVAKWQPAVCGLLGSQFTVRFDENEWTHPENVGTAQALSTANFPQVNDKIENHFETLTWTGNGGTQTMTGTDWGSDDQLVWIKQRNKSDNNVLFDSVRGDGTKALYTNSTRSEVTPGELDSSFGITYNSDGFTLGSWNNINQTGIDTVAWRFRAGQSRANTVGTLSATVSANPTLGFSIVKYTGDANSSGTVEHGLGKKPKMIIVKRLDGGSGGWYTYIESLGATKTFELQLSGAAQTYPWTWNDTEPTDTVFSVAGDININGDGNTYIAYVFAETDFIKPFYYTGIPSTDGPFVSLGISPEFLLLRGNGTSDWGIIDNVRDSINPSTKILYANDPKIESSSTSIDLLSNGFKSRIGNHTIFDYSGYTHIGLAIGTPTQNANAR